VDQNRVGDHICDISNLRRLRATYQGWELTRSLDDILRELAAPPGELDMGRPRRLAGYRFVTPGAIQYARRWVPHGRGWVAGGRGRAASATPPAGAAEPRLRAQCSC